MLTSVQNLIERLNAAPIRYCHWKSNLALTQSLDGETDIDLLVHRKDAAKFRAILSQHCFRPALTTDGEAFPSVEHYYALDEESGALVHVHAYYRVVTGESLAKNYRLPIEEMLLENTRLVGPIPLPLKSAELVVFTLRMMLKHTSPMELYLLRRYWKQVRQEIEWLMEDEPLDETLCFVKHWLPTVEPELFTDCIAALRAPAPLLRRITLGYKLRSQLSPYARHNLLLASVSEVQKFTIMAFRRLLHLKRGMVPQSGGAIIAFVGSEATGKSTLLAEMSKWLGEHFAVEHIHVGKPKATALTFVPNSLVPAMRAWLPSYRTTRIEEQLVKKERTKTGRPRYPLISAVRAALLAHDRRALLTKAYRRAANGTIILCDRYPSTQAGAPDSPQLSNVVTEPGQSALHRQLADIESQMYRSIPPPDLVIYLSAPLEVTVQRNATRGKKEPEEYVRWRHARTSNLEFGRIPVYRINTDQPFEKTVLEVKKAIWGAL
jgi:thymidylate kinase